MPAAWSRKPSCWRKFGPDGKNIYGRPVGVQWQNGDLASIFPKEFARAPMIKS
jgi:branched-chain amino acid transport system substrate-binding protein